MSLYILNSSVDTPDIVFKNSNQDSNFNEQESIIELLIEKVLDFGNIIPESNNLDSNEHNSFEKLKLEVYFDNFKYTFYQPLYNYNTNLFNYQTAIIENIFSTIFSPPPELIS